MSNTAAQIITNITIMIEIMRGLISLFDFIGKPETRRRYDKLIEKIDRWNEDGTNPTADELQEVCDEARRLNVELRKIANSLAAKGNAETGPR